MFLIFPKSYYYHEGRGQIMDIVDTLLKSDEPAIRYKTLVNLPGEDPDSLKTRKARNAIKRSPRVELLRSERDRDSGIPYHPYQKWRGAHWALVNLADLCYPPGDRKLIPLRDQVYDWLLSEEHQKGIRQIKGLTRRCASQEGNAIYSTLILGIADKRTDELARRLVEWQWPDGGWNCDKRPQAKNSSYIETITPLRGLALHAKITGNRDSRKAAERAAELLLKRHLFKRQSDGGVMKESFVQLKYPRYYEYDFLFALVVLAEAGYIDNRRCKDALNLLESKRLPDGGFPCDRKLYRVSRNIKYNRTSLVDWGRASTNTRNEFITVDALSVLGKN
jgi:hypothetical protein